MPEVKLVKADNIFNTIRNMLREGKCVRVTVTGMSMYPFLREGIDSVLLYDISFENLHRGDIALVHNNDGQYILHRVLRKSGNCIFMAGDSLKEVEGPINSDSIFAAVTAVWRGDKRIECTNMKWKLLSHLWLLMMPVRSIMLKIIRHIDKSWA